MERKNQTSLPHVYLIGTAAALLVSATLAPNETTPVRKPTPETVAAGQVAAYLPEDASELPRLKMNRVR
ncbi:MAG: hypothetical protein WD467_01340 [Candidatus Saccharimonadales bacterium]